MIRDSRHLYGARDQTPDGVEKAWAAFVADKLQRGQAPFANRPQQTAFQDAGIFIEHLDAYVNDGRWVADCPNCNAGIGVWNKMDTGACFDCGTVFKINFPPPGQVRRAEIVLSKRPQSGNRNWIPGRGETVEDLKVENASRGYDFTETGEMP